LPFGAPRLHRPDPNANSATHHWCALDSDAARQGETNVTEGATQPAGWYYAEGDPPGSQRFWDGSQWVGGPQVAPMAAGVAEGTGVTSENTGFAAPPKVAGNTAHLGRPAEFGERAVAYVIDAGLSIGAYIAAIVLGVFVGFVSSTLGVVLAVVGMLAAFAFTIWNLIIRQGNTGQSIGKQQQNIRLVADATGEPAGVGLVFGRYLVAAVISSVSLGLGGLLDLLWPLWDEDKKRLTDKMLSLSVVDAAGD